MGDDYSCYALLHSKDVKGPASKHALVYLALDCALREMLPHARLLCVGHRVQMRPHDR